ncbi:eukaryotic translation elongation factor 1 delta a (guanine nucleotide exchange protein) isoform X6 [Pimephales promelas]|nr:eukaryotic translation elongation factor 1 delta a (guanine nucleotide exchange protein) isoform X6 [Pimephales promelas]
MSGLQGLAQENIWFDKSRYDEAERCFYETKNGVPQTSQSQNASKPEDQSELVSRFKSLELDNKNLHKVVDDLRATLSKLESRMAILEKGQSPASKSVTVTKAAPVQTPKVEKHNGAADDDDDDIDLFGSDEEDEEAERIKAERVKEYSQRKAKKPALIAKSSILLDVKPWDDETDMSKLEGCVRSIQMDGLLWGASKLVPVGYGIKKLQINCVVEDDKVGTDILEEEITKYEDYVQSVDIAAFNKI